MGGKVLGISRVTNFAAGLSETPLTHDEVTATANACRDKITRLLGALLPRYVDTQVYQSLVEAHASEQGARMTAMSSATKNAGEMM
jgi:ATP synthase F1 gamma subunit